MDRKEWKPTAFAAPEATSSYRELLGLRSGEDGPYAGENLPRRHETAGPFAEFLNETETAADHSREDFSNHGSDRRDQNRMSANRPEQTPAGVGQTQGTFTLGEVIAELLPLPFSTGNQGHAALGEFVELAHGSVLRRLSQSLASSERVVAKRRGLVLIFARRTKVRTPPQMK